VRPKNAHLIYKYIISYPPTCFGVTYTIFGEFRVKDDCHCTRHSLDITQG